MNIDTWHVPALWMFSRLHVVNVMMRVTTRMKFYDAASVSLMRDAFDQCDP